MHDVHKILIIRFSSIGDIVLASPLIRGLRAAYPEALIDFLVKSRYAELVRSNPQLSSVIELKTNELRELRVLRKKIRREQYDVVVDIHNSLRSRCVRLFSGARSTVVVNKRVFARMLLVKWKWNVYGRPVSVADRYLETVSPIGVTNDRKGLEEIHTGADSILARSRGEQAQA